VSSNEIRTPRSDVASLVIPAFNERNRIEASIRSIADWRRTRPGGWDWEVIVVDDGSSDGTKGIAEKTARDTALPLRIVRNETNHGKGAAIRAGVLVSSGDPVLTSDVDLSTPLSEWVKLAERLPTHPIAIGSRALDERTVGRRQPLYRRLLGKAGNVLVRLVAVSGIHDTQCGFKLFRGETARELYGEARIEGFASDIEILYLARRRGLPIAEVPVLWFNSSESKVSVFRDALPTLWDVLRLRRLHRRGGP